MLLFKRNRVSGRQHEIVWSATIFHVLCTPALGKHKPINGNPAQSLQLPALGNRNSGMRDYCEILTTKQKAHKDKDPNSEGSTGLPFLLTFRKGHRSWTVSSPVRVPPSPITQEPADCQIIQTAGSVLFRQLHACLFTDWTAVRIPQRPKFKPQPHRITRSGASEESLPAPAAFLSVEKPDHHQCHQPWFRLQVSASDCTCSSVAGDIGTSTWPHAGGPGHRRNAVGPCGAESARMPAASRRLTGPFLCCHPLPGERSLPPSDGWPLAALAGFHPHCYKVSSWETRASAWSLLSRTYTTECDTSLTLHSLC